MKKPTGLAIALVMAATTACASGVRYDYDPATNFRELRTYDWMERPEPAPGDATAALTNNDLLDRRVKLAVNEELSRKGFRQNASDPDFLIAYHIGLEDKIDVQDWGYRYRRVGPYWIAASRQTEVREYTQGTLIIDFVDAEAKELVWRASGSGRAREFSSPEAQQESLNRAVSKLLEEFPPPGIR